MKGKIYCSSSLESLFSSSTSMSESQFLQINRYPCVPHDWWAILGHFGHLLYLNWPFGPLHTQHSSNPLSVSSELDDGLGIFLFFFGRPRGAFLTPEVPGRSPIDTDLAFFFLTGDAFFSFGVIFLASVSANCGAFGNGAISSSVCSKAGSSTGSIGFKSTEAISTFDATYDIDDIAIEWA